ncbi:MAG: thermonuclease family protein [Pseudorhodoplanes sp.]
MGTISGLRGARSFGGSLWVGIVLAVSPATAESCQSGQAIAAKVAQVIDARTFRLEDGRVVRLAGIESLTLRQTDRDESQSIGIAARTALQNALDGRTVLIEPIRAKPDRYDRMVAYVVIAQPEGSRSETVQEMLVKQGHAITAARIDGRACALRLLALEQAARDAKLGLWADPGYALKDARDAAGLLADLGRYAVVEGKVLSVRESGGTIYVNFGWRWTRDFAVTILKRQDREFAAAGLVPKKLEGRRVRIRGFIEERGGPRIEATRPEQIEILDHDASASKRSGSLNVIDSNRSRHDVVQKPLRAFGHRALAQN